MRKTTAVVLTLAAFAAPSLARAQGVEAAGIYASLSGDDFQGTNAGVGLDGQFRFRVAPKISLGLGGNYTTHSIEGVDENLNVIGIFAEPRLAISMPASPLAPFVGVRVAYLRESFSSGGFDASANGWMAGATGGVMYRLAPKADLVVAVVFATVNFGDAEVNGSTVANSDASGTSLALRAGVSLALGR